MAKARQIDREEVFPLLRPNLLSLVGELTLEDTIVESTQEKGGEVVFGNGGAIHFIYGV